MVFTVVGVVVIYFFTSVVANSCELHVDLNNLGVFTQTLGKIDVLLDINTSVINLEDEESIYVYCKSPLRSFNRNNNYNRIGFYENGEPGIIVNEDNFCCKNGKLFLENTELEWTNRHMISCKRVASYFEHTVKNCNETGIAYGFKLNGIPVVFSEICYDMELMKVKFMHMRSGVRSPVLANQVLFNPTLANYSLEWDIQLDKIINVEEDEPLQIAVNEMFADYKKLLKFEIGPILPTKSYFGMWNQYIDKLSSLNAAPFWTSLKYGNWANLGRTLTSLSDDTKYEVYAGTSGAIPSSYGCENSDQTPFNYFVSSRKRTVPLYIWNYIVDTNGSEDGVVIIGVNSPFAEFSANSSSVIFCNDICDSYKWLNPLKSTRKIPVLGYIFCCSPKEVRAVLADFPVIDP